MSDRMHFPEAEKLVTQEILLEIDDNPVGFKAGTGLEVGRVASPQMRDVRAEKYGISRRKWLYGIADQPRAVAFQDREKLEVRMKVPVRVKVRITQVMDNDCF